MQHSSNPRARTPAPHKTKLSGSGEAEFVGDGFHGLDTEGYVLVEIDAHLLGSVDDVVAVDTAGEGFVLQSLSHALDVHFVERLGGFDEGDGRDESG